MKYDIQNRHTGEIQFTADFACANDFSDSVKIGLAVRWAIENDVDLSGADLTEANLRYADLSKADLTEANLRYADLTKANLTEADLTEANLHGALPSEANLSKAHSILRVGPSADGHS